MSDRPTSKKLSLSDLKLICKENGIANTIDYKEKYKAVRGLVAHPERIFKSEWGSYKDFFGIQNFIKYSELRKIILPFKLKSKFEYCNFVKSTDNKSYPLDPQTAYSNEWKNWYVFLGKDEPYKIRFISHYYKEWGDKINEFMKQAYGGGTKETHLCRFVRVFIEKYDKSKTPEEFVTKKKVIIKNLRNELNSLSTDNMRRNIIMAAKEFCDFVIDNYLTIEDEETGEIVRVMNVRNPLALLLNDKSVTKPIRGESTKPCLQYHFVQKTQFWLIPSSAKTFSDLTHLHRFDSDWIEVQKNIIDFSDPDCVYKKIGKQYYIWVPIDWMHVYTLTKVPLRGRQIAYNDSGEFDNNIADIDSNSKLIWIKNNNNLAGLTNCQGFIQQIHSGGFGMYITTNKTSNLGNGYSIPWIPEDLAYWIVRLRKWQQKYNSVMKPARWMDCRRTNLNEIQLKAKGVNSFLFRAFKDFEPKNPGLALTNRLAAALYHIQPSNLKLAELKGFDKKISNYRSQFTPHSMRVSLITAYIMEMGMPIEVVMKIVGHSSIIMTIYYCKVSNGDIRKRLEEGEKLLSKNKAEATQKMIEQNNLESVKNQLVVNNKDLINSLTNKTPAGNFIFRDYGICPFAASRCEDGGEIIGATQVNAPVSNGYLGMQNCLRCRHFITGPAFLGGLLSTANEILLQANIQSEICSKLQEKVSRVTLKIEELEREEYVANLKKTEFDIAERNLLERRQRKLEAEYESSAKKMDMLLCDLQAVYRLISLCSSVVNSLPDHEKNKISLIKMPDSEVRIEFEEVSHFQQLNEVCENAVIYESANASNAILARSQYLDKMSDFNGLATKMFMLTESEQLKAGNDISSLLKARIKSWSRIDDIVQCRVSISDLLEKECIQKSELELIVKAPLLDNRKSYNDF